MKQRCRSVKAERCHLGSQLEQANHWDSMQKCG